MPNIEEGTAVKKQYLVRKVLVVITVLVVIFLVVFVIKSIYENSARKNPTLQTYKEKLPLLEKQAKENPKNLTIQKEYAHALYVTSNTEQAIAGFSNVVSLNPNESQSYIYLGNLYRTNKEYEKAVTAYEQSLKLQPKQVSGYINLAHLYIYTLKNEEKGFEVFKMAIVNNPDNEDIMIMLAKTYEQLQNTVKAKETYTAVLQKNPQNSAAKQALSRLQ